MQHTCICDCWTGTVGHGDVAPPPQFEVGQIDLKVALAATKAMTETFGLKEVSNLSLADVVDLYAYGVDPPLQSVEKSFCVEFALSVVRYACETLGYPRASQMTLRDILDQGLYG